MMVKYNDWIESFNVMENSSMFKDGFTFDIQALKVNPATKNVSIDDSLNTEEIVIIDTETIFGNISIQSSSFENAILELHKELDLLSKNEKKEV